MDDAVIYYIVVGKESSAKLTIWDW